MNENKITFSFGQNWKEYLSIVSEKQIQLAVGDIEEWLGADAVKGKRIVDIGSGSGIHSLAFHLLGASDVLSLDYDPNSVQATRLMWEKAGRPQSWRVVEASILDRDFVLGQGEFDIVYSWGVLHHTGNMWEAIENAMKMVGQNGKLLISIYTKGDSYAEHLKMKQKYNNSSTLFKKLMVYGYIVNEMRAHVSRGENPFKWMRPKKRGMSWYYDVIDWLGGLPYEVATEDEIVRFSSSRNFTKDRVMPMPEGACSIYLFTQASK